MSWPFHSAEGAEDVHACCAHRFDRATSVAGLEVDRAADVEELGDFNRPHSAEPEIESPIRDVTVIVPAFNEERLIEECLRRVLGQVTSCRMEVIVVANGCDDETAKQARRLKYEAEPRNVRLVVLDTVKGNKPLALNLAETHASGRVRIYLDADICITENVVEEIWKTLSSGGALHCAPRLEVAEAKSWVTRAYVAIWSQLPLVRTRVVGCGLYAVNTAGRARWRDFPELISDDKFVRLQFEGAESVIAAGAKYFVQMPEGLRELIRVRGRWSRGNRDLAKAFPALSRREPSHVLEAALYILRNPRCWLSAPVFVMVFALGECLALCNRRKGLSLWERADRARAVLAPHPQADRPEARTDRLVNA